MDFSLSDDLADLKERTERFVREQIIPYDNDTRQTALSLQDCLKHISGCSCQRRPAPKQLWSGRS